MILNQRAIHKTQYKIEFTKKRKTYFIRNTCNKWHPKRFLAIHLNLTRSGNIQVTENQEVIY